MSDKSTRVTGKGQTNGVGQGGALQTEQEPKYRESQFPREMENLRLNLE